MWKKSFALLLSALLMLGLLPAAALAEGADDPIEATKEALTEAVADSGRSKIVLAAGSETIALDAPLTIDRSLTIELNGQTITASYETGDALSTLTVFNIKPGGHLTVTGSGAVKAASLPGGSQQQATPYAFFLAGDSGNRSLTLKGKVSVAHSGHKSNLIALGSGAALTLQTSKNIDSDEIAVIALPGASGYSIDIHMDGSISAPKAMILHDGYSGITLQNTTLNGALIWDGDGSSAPTLNDLAADGYWAFVGGTAVSEDAFNSAPEGGKNYSFRRCFTVTYNNGADADEPTHVDRVMAGAAAPTYIPSRSNYNFVGWDPALPGSITADGSYTAIWAGTFAVTNALTGLSSNGAATATEGQDYTATLSPDGNYTLPESVSVTLTDSGDALGGVSFENGLLTVPGAAITGPITITAEGVPIPVYTVTLPSGEGYTAAGSDGSTVLRGHDFRFTVTIADGYEKGSGFAVKVGDAALSEADGVYTIENVQEDKTVTVEGVTAIPVYTVTLPTGTGYTAAASDGSTVLRGHDFRFTVTIADGYEKGSGFAVKVGDTALSEADGVYTIEDVREDKTVTVEGVTAIPVYTVTLPTGEGYTAKASSGTSVRRGGNFSFTVTIADGYEKGSGFAVKVGDTALSEAGGVYTIENVQEDKTVTVEGVTAIPVYTVTLPTGEGYTAKASSGSSVRRGGSFSFTVTIADGYEKGSGFAVKVGDTALSEAGGVYTIEDIRENKTVTVEGVAPIPIYTVTLPTGSGYTAKASSGTSVRRGGSFSFTVTIASGYEKSSAFAVKVGGTALSEAGGVYTIEDIRENKIVTVEGVAPIPTITYTDPQRLSSSTAKFNFTSSQSGKYWYQISLKSDEPSANEIMRQVNKANCTAGTQMSFELRSLDSAAARYIFVLVESDQGIRSKICRIDIPAYQTTYSVTLPSGEGFTVTASGSSSPVAAGGTFKFKVTLEKGYRKGSGFAVKSNGVTLNESNGVYTISDIQGNQTITVTGVEKTPVTYTVTLPKNPTGYSVNPTSGSASPVAAGGSYSFTVTVNSGYSGANMTVKANNLTVPKNGNVYTVSNIQANQTITVSGVNYTGGGGGGGNYTPVVGVAPSITTTTLAAATLGSAYSQQLTATGTAPITWTFTGTLPDGISLGSTTGLLSGTPTSEGTFRFAVKASNARGTATRQMTMVVAGVSYNVTAGNNTQWARGTEEGLTFQGSGKENFSVEIDGSRVDSKYLSYSTDQSAVTVSSEYLSTLSTGSHNLTLHYKNGSAKAKFSIRANSTTAAPAISAQPLSGEVKEGDSITLNVTASGTAPLTYQWQVDKGDGKGWTDLPDGTGAALSVRKVTAEQNGWKYRCTVSNASGKTESNSATLTVRDSQGNEIPAPTAAPASTTKRSPLKTILGIALGLVVVGLAGVGGLWYYQSRKYDE
ncbi:MAG: immunoglobulin domain-containing protein [Oscillospiraceae bacterium]|nr:immunoglobulin domain-containing protein [Oscillospiraceae bacterium]